MTRTDLPPIIVDTREQTPLVFPAVVQLKRGTLKTGDYSVAGYEDQFTVERKSLPDLVHTVIHERERFEHELERMRSFRFRRILVTVPYADVSAGSYSFCRANPRSVIASINAFEMRYGVPAVFAAGVGEAATRVINWAYYFVREMTKAESVARGLNHTITLRQAGATGVSQMVPPALRTPPVPRKEDMVAALPNIITQPQGDCLC